MFRNDRFTGFDGEGGWQKWKIIINKDARFKQLGHLLKILKKLRRRARILFNVTPIVLLQLQKSIQFYKSNIIKKIFFIVWTDRSQLTQKPSVSYYLCSCAISWLISSSSLIPVNSPEPTELELSCVTGANGQYSRFHRTHDTTTPQTHTQKGRGTSRGHHTGAEWDDLRLYNQYMGKSRNGSVHSTGPVTNAFKSMSPESICLDIFP